MVVEKKFEAIPIGKLKVRRAKSLIKGMLYKGFITFITGCAKHGKSTLAWHLCICLTTGKPFLGRFPVKGKHKVLYCCLEDHLGELRQKIKYMLQGRRFPKHFYALSTDSLSLPADFEKIKDVLEQQRIDIVVIDTFRRAHGRDEDSSSDMASVNNGLRKLAKQTGATVIPIHHKGKNADHKDVSDSLRGTSDFNALWETVIYIDKQKDMTKIMVSHRGQKDLEDSAYKLLLGDFDDPITGEPPIIDLVFVDPDIQTQIEQEKMVINTLVAEPASGNELEARLKGKGLPRPKIDDTLQRLKNQGKVICRGKGKNTKWHLL